MVNHIVMRGLRIIILLSVIKLLKDPKISKSRTKKVSQLTYHSQTTSCSIFNEAGYYSVKVLNFKCCSQVLPISIESTFNFYINSDLKVCLSSKKSWKAFILTSKEMEKKLKIINDLKKKSDREMWSFI